MSGWLRAGDERMENRSSLGSCRRGGVFVDIVAGCGQDASLLGDVHEVLDVLRVANDSVRTGTLLRFRESS